MLPLSVTSISTVRCVSAAAARVTVNVALPPPVCGATPEEALELRMDSAP